MEGAARQNSIVFGDTVFQQTVIEHLPREATQLRMHAVLEVEHVRWIAQHVQTQHQALVVALLNGLLVLDDRCKLKMESERERG